jgi:hypothetical protein
MSPGAGGYGGKVSFWRRENHDSPLILGDPLPVPVSGVDGWTLRGTPLADLRGDAAREIATHLHGIELGVETAWTYGRAAELLEEAGYPRMALTALDAWLSHPAAASRPEETRWIERQRARLHSRLARALVTKSPGPQESS